MSWIRLGRPAPSGFYKKSVKHAGFEGKGIWWDPLRLVIETSEAKFWGSDSQAETVDGLNQQQGEEEGSPASEKAKKLSPMQAGSLAIVI